MNRVAAVTFTVSSVPWAATALLVPTWWQSPAFGRAGLPLWLSGLLWTFAATIMVAMWAGVALRPSAVAFGLLAYGLPTFLMGMSVVWFTIEANAVSAIGSAIAWLALSLSAIYRAVTIAGQVRAADES